MECNVIKENAKLQGRVEELAAENIVLKSCITNLTQQLNNVNKKRLPIMVIRNGNKSLRIFTNSPTTKTIGKLRATIQEFMMREKENAKVK